MQTIQSRINAFISLGRFLSQFTTKGIEQKQDIPFNDLFFDGFKRQLQLAEQHNQWFTKDNLLFACESWSRALTEANMTRWIANEQLQEHSDKTVAIIMAGNIPLVGFHDFLSVLISGHSVLVKQSSSDKQLTPFLASYLEHIYEGFQGTITFTEDKLSHFDAVIATGSNNTARYFEYYFKDKPSIIRKNRNSVAVLAGNETDKQLQELAEDVFRYFGLGCRSVSKLFVPKDYDFDAFFKGMYHWHDIVHNAKYANNYDYNKAVYLMSEFSILENGFLMIKEDHRYASPIATVFYEYYDSLDSLKSKLQTDSDFIQCVVADNVVQYEVPFGQTQHPQLWDYADNINTLQFLATIT